jgi:PAS domain S-box-containing protein
MSDPIASDSTILIEDDAISQIDDLYRELERTQQELREARDKLEEREQIEAALHKSDARLRTIIDATPAVVFIKDTESLFLMVNRRFEELFGQTLADVIGRNNIDGLDDGAAAVIRNNDLAVLESGQAMEFEETAILPDGPHVFLSVKSPLFDQHGRVYALCGIATDITERKRTEMALIKAKKEAESANLSKNEFLSRMSHELRTPLNAILGFGQLLQGGPHDAEAADNIDQILQAGGRLLNLINEILDVSAIDAGQFTLIIEPLNLREIVEETISQVRTLAAETGVSLNFATCSSGTVLADGQRLKQVLVNLTSNAIKYNRRGGEVSLECSPAETLPAPAIRICVRDTGPGIAPDKLGSLFTPFARLGGEETGVPGTGLGLAVSKRLVEAMGGRLGLETAAGQGSTFWVELPRVA